MNKTQWKNDWKYTPNQTISISAWGDVGPYWVGKKANKVQEEPLVYWAGKASGCPQYVTIVRMRRKRWVWAWFNTGYRFEDASQEDTARAVQNAENWLDRDYAYFALGSGIFSTVINPITDPIAYTVAMVAKNSEDQFYCSQLVWRAWYNVSSEFDIQPLKPCILPEDFKEGLSGGVTVGVGSYQNY